MKPVNVDLVVPQGWSEVVYAKDQPEYIPLPTLKCVDGRAVSRWEPTPEERAKIAAGADVYLTVHTFNQPLQPVLLTVNGAPVEPIPMTAMEVNARAFVEKAERRDGPPVPPRVPGHNPVG
jgi:hypothetical protein